MLYLKWILLILSILLSLVNANDSYYSQPVKSGDYYILDNENTLNIVRELRFQGLKLKDSDSILIDFVYGTPKAGWIKLKKGDTLLNAIKKIGSKEREKTKKVIFYSSDTIYDFSRYFSKLSNTTPYIINALYRKYSKWYEGGIIASIYYIPYGLDVQDAIKYMIRRSDLIFKKIANKYGVKYPSKEFKKYLIIASIIQKESWIKEDMPKISAVIHNRLKRGMKLQLDGTLNYGRYSHVVVTPLRIRSDKSRYNTYLYKGLPPEPLGSVTIEALEASFNPDPKPYLYFVNNIFGTHTFCTTYSQHLANICKIKTMRAKIRKFKEYQKGKEIVYYKEDNISSSYRDLNGSCIDKLVDDILDLNDSCIMRSQN